jgi:predicted transposase YbfD/YdcC
LDIEGAIVTIDAMGCQKEIAAKIIEKKADYLLAVKGNQGHLEDDIQEAFQQGTVADTNEQIEMGHGRIEKRTCTIIRDTEWICKTDEWKKLSTLVAVHAERIDKATGKKEEQTRYYISSSSLADAKAFNNAARFHWGIENNLHWCLDVIFKEDESCKRAGNAAQNFSVATKIALNLLNKHQDIKGTKQVSIRRKQFQMLGRYRLSPKSTLRCLKFIMRMP